MPAECRHILPRGTKCKAIALRGKPYCYFHEQLHTYRQDGTRVDKAPLALPSIEDARGIQLALMQIMGSITTRRLEPQQAGSLLYSLQLAIQAFDRVSRTPPDEIVEMTYCDGLGADIGVEQERCEPHPECAACTQIACSNVARQNKLSTRQVLDAQRATRETPDLIAIATQRSLPQPAPESEKDLVKLCNCEPQPEPEPELDRKTLDRLALELRLQADLAAR